MFFYLEENLIYEIISSVIKMLIIGSHVSFGNNQLIGAVEEALSYGANTFMFYTGAPTNTVRKKIDEAAIKKAQQLMQDNNIDIDNVICHAPYIVNPANATDSDKYQFSIDFIRNELKRCDEMGIKQMVLHPGSAVKITKEEGLNNIVNALNKVLDGTTHCKILLETMAGKGSECASTIDEMAYLIKNIKKQDQIGVCIDTCHINDAGYDLTDFDSYLTEFSTKIGLEKIGCLHINDSKNPLASHKDRHANLGKGTIGFTTLLKIIYHEKLQNIPKILETPYIGDTDDDKNRLYPPYKYEIAMIREQKYDDNYYEKIRQDYQKK